MHSFVPVLIAAALATLGSTAPVGLSSTSLPVSTPAALPSQLPSVLLPTGLPSTSLPASAPVDLPSQLPSVPLPVGLPSTSLPVSAPATLPSQLPSAPLPNVNGTAPLATSSIAVIFDTISTETQPYTEQLTYLTPSNATITEITNIVYSIKAPIVAAVPQLEALAGQEASIILASVAAVAGDAELTVAQVAGIVGGYVDLVLAAAGHVLDVTSTEGSDIVADVKGVLTDLGDALTSLIGATIPLVNGLPASLTPVVVPVESVISDLNLIELAIILDLSI